jgi:hypothetical protein
MSGRDATSGRVAQLGSLPNIVDVPTDVAESLTIVVTRPIPTRTVSAPAPSQCTCAPSKCRMVALLARSTQNCDRRGFFRVTYTVNFSTLQTSSKFTGNSRHLAGIDSCLTESVLLAETCIVLGYVVCLRRACVSHLSARIQHSGFKSPYLAATLHPFEVAVQVIVRCVASYFESWNGTCRSPCATRPYLFNGDFVDRGSWSASRSLHAAACHTSPRMIRPFCVHSAPT